MNIKNVMLGLVALLVMGCGGGSSGGSSTGSSGGGGGSTSSTVSLAVSVPVVSMGNTVTVTASGGSGSYQYSANGNGTMSALGVFTPNVAGTDTVSVFDVVTQATATATVTVKSATALYAAGNQTCAKLNTGELECFGNDVEHTIVASGTTVTATTPYKSSTTVSGSNINGFSGSDDTGNISSCVIVSGGVLCSGDNNYGQLGNNTTTPGALVQAQGLTSGVTQISTSAGFSCALKSGEVWCWGYNFNGEIGNGGTTNQLTPYEVISSGATYIATADGSACAVVSNALQCWGDNTLGELNATTGVTCNGHPCSQTPVSVTGMTTNVTSVAISMNGMVCGIQSNGVKCWGGVDGGATTYEDESGTNSAPTSTPSSVLSMTSGVSALVANEASFCALKGGNVYCWGDNTYGNIGDGSVADAYTATEVVSSGNVTSIVAGDYHVCALKTDGSISCWGYNNDGQLGNGGTSQESSPLVPNNWI
jgi:alpha-tubulin suppressor-like RCC1 family protein